MPVTIYLGDAPDAFTLAWREHNATCAVCHAWCVGRRPLRPGSLRDVQESMGSDTCNLGPWELTCVKGNSIRQRCRVEHGYDRDDIEFPSIWRPWRGWLSWSKEEVRRWRETQDTAHAFDHENALRSLCGLVEFCRFGDDYSRIPISRHRAMKSNPCQTCVEKATP